MQHQETLATEAEGLSIQEKKVIVSLLSSTLIFAVYFYFVFQIYRGQQTDLAQELRFWATAFLILIPVSIVAQIIIAILFAILNTIATREQDPDLTDERDKLIGLKATRNGFVVFILGFLLTLVMLATGQSLMLSFLVLAFAGYGSSLASDLTQLYFYRRGM